MKKAFVVLSLMLFVGSMTTTAMAAANGINVTSFSTLGGAQAANYTLTQPTGLTANITPLGLNVLGASGIEAKEFVDKLVTWADVIRKSFYEGALSEIISTRRLVHICEAFGIFGQNKMKAIEPKTIYKNVIKLTKTLNENS